jgi:ABC-2 type transport system permease protein
MTAVTSETSSAKNTHVRQREPIQRIPLSRLTSVELRKMFDTRSGFWLMASIGIAAVIATVSVIIFAHDSDQTYGTFAAAIGFPMAVILPIIAILSVTSEWSQRSGLTTFTLVPHRARVIQAKAIATVGVAVVSMVAALAIGVIGNLIGPAVHGTPIVWDVSVSDFIFIVFANVLGLLVGFMLGVLIRNSPAAIVGYFVYSFVLPTLSQILADKTSWFNDLQPWVDFNHAQGALFDGALTGREWANLGVAGVIWLIIPMAIGVKVLMRSEVK